MPDPDDSAHIPDDLSTEGAHRANDPPNDTGGTTRSPTGPDPASGSAEVTPALFQVMQGRSEESIRVRVHPPRRVVEDADEEYEDVAQVRTPDALREVLGDLPDAEYHAVFEVHDTGRAYVEHQTSLDHPWLFPPEYDLATFFRSADAAAEYAEGLDAT